MYNHNLTDEAFAIVNAGGEAAVTLVDNLLEEIKELRDKVRSGVSSNTVYTPVFYVEAGESINDALDRLLTDTHGDTTCETN